LKQVYTRMHSQKNIKP